MQLSLLLGVSLFGTAKRRWRMDRNVCVCNVKLTVSMHPLFMGNESKCATGGVSMLRLPD